MRTCGSVPIPQDAGAVYSQLPVGSEPLAVVVRGDNVYLDYLHDLDEKHRASARVDVLFMGHSLDLPDTAVYIGSFARLGQTAHVFWTQDT